MCTRFSSVALSFAVHYIVCWRCGTLDVTTIYRGGSDLQSNYTTVECHARTNALGLPFISPNGSTFEPEVGLTVPSCQIGLKPNCPWTSQGWEITGGSDLSLPPLKLHYESVHIHTSGVLMSQFIPLFWPRFNFSVRASTRGTARVLLLTDADVAVAELYVVDVVHNMLYLAHQTSSMLKCGRGRQYIHDMDLGPGLGIRRCHSIGNIYIRWLGEEYVMFRMDMTGGKMQLWRNGTSVALFSQLDPSPLRIKYVALTTSEIERDWVLYLDGRVWSLIGINGLLKSPILALGSEARVCISFFAYMDSVPGSGIKVSARFYNGSLKHMGHIYSNDWENQKKWMLQRLMIDLSEDVGNVDMQIVIEGLKGNPFGIVSVHGLMGCNPDDNEEIAVTQVSLDTLSPFVCEVPSTYERKEGTRPCPPVCLHGGECESATGQCACPPGFIGDGCEEGCGANSFGRDCMGQCSGRKDGCTGLVLCVPIVGCNCATGYTGSSCNLECIPGWYGPNCAFSCGVCNIGTFCDVFTGVCPEGCSQGYYPPLCNMTYSYLLQSPTVTEVGATRVSFTFMAGSEHVAGAGDPRFYQVQLREDKALSFTSRTPVLLRRHPGQPVTGTVDELRPGIEYTLRIILVDGDGSIYSNETVVPFVTVITTCQVPTKPTYDIKATWRKRHEFEVEWKYEPNDYTACGLVHYRVYLREGWRRYLYNTTVQNSITVPDRSPFFRYTVQIQAMTSRGPSVISEPATVRTVQGAPSRVIRLAIKQISPTELEVRWREPRSTTGKIKHYIIEYECLRYLACPGVDCRDSKGHSETVDWNIRLPGLHPHAQYSIKVAGFTVEMGPWAKIKAATSFTVPEAAPAPAERAVVSRTASTMEITWEPVADCRLLHGFPLYYHYWLYTKEISSKMALVAEGNVTHPPVNFTSLMAYTDYMVQIEQVVTGGLHNPAHKLEILARTRGTVSPVVRELQTTNVTSSSLSLKWSFPMGVPRDAVKHFVIIFMCVRLLACEEHSYNCSSNGTIETDTTEATIDYLQPYSKYDIKVAAFTGEVGNFATLTLSTLTATPGVAPRADPLKTPISGSTWISVSWLPPEDCSHQHGPLLGYRHRVFKEEGSVSWTIDAGSDPTFTKDTSANFTMLPSFTAFRVEIVIVNNISDGTPWSELQMFNSTVWTRPKVPDAVKDLVAYKHGETVVGLRWRATRYLHGPIDSVDIHVTGNNVTQVQRVKTLSCPAWRTHMCHEITSLEPNTTYTISVRPFSSVVGEEGLPTNTTVQTVEGVPDPPSFARLVRKTDKSFVIEWGHPNMSNGILRSFRILTDHVDSYNSEMCCDSSMSADVQVFRENATYAAQIKGLKPASEYFITVVAVTHTPSLPVTMTIYTKPGVPQLRETPPYAIQETVTNSTAEVVLSPASDFSGGPIWVYFVMVCGVGNHVHYDVDSDPVLTEVKAEVKKRGFIAMTLNDEELDDPLIVTIGNGEESLGLYGFIRNQPLHPNTSYIVVQVVMSEYMNSRSFGIAESEAFTTRHFNHNALE